MSQEDGYCHSCFGKELDRAFNTPSSNNTKHDWIPLCSDINTPWYDTYHWWRCANCGKESNHTKQQNEREPIKEGCEAKEKGSIFPLSSI